MKQLGFKDSIGRSSRFIHPAVGICLALSLNASLTLAQNDDEDHHFTLSVGGGLTTITGRDAGKYLHLYCGSAYSRSVVRRSERVCPRRWRLPALDG
jgi:hypothetical protein